MRWNTGLFPEKLNRKFDSYIMRGLHLAMLKSCPGRLNLVPATEQTVLCQTPYLRTAAATITVRLAGRPRRVFARSREQSADTSSLRADGLHAGIAKSICRLTAGAPARFRGP